MAERQNVAGPPKRRDLRAVLVGSGALGNLVLIAVSIFLLWQCECIVEIQPEGELSVRTWPRFALLMIIALSLFNASQDVFSAWRSGKSSSGDQGATESIWADVDFKTLGVAVALLFIYPLLMQIVGFALATVVFISIFLFWGNYRHPVKTPLIVLGGTLLILYVFVKIVYVPLPRGMGFFDDATIALYQFLRIF